LIRRGVILGIHYRLLKTGDHFLAMKRAKKITDLIAGIVFLLSAVVDVLMSFLTGRWKITWIIWPMSAFSLGFFIGMIETIQKNKK
jgi:hypothetical protein